MLTLAEASDCDL